MPTAFPITRSVAPVLRALDLEPDHYAGAREVIDTLFRLHFEPARSQISREDYAAATASAIDYWRFQIDVARPHRENFIGPIALPDNVAGSLIGGIELLLDARIRRWATHAAQDACRIVFDAHAIKTPGQFGAAPADTRFYLMVDTYCDLCAQRALIGAKPQQWRAEGIDNVTALGLATRLDFPACALTANILRAEAEIMAFWNAPVNSSPALRLN